MIAHNQAGWIAWGNYRVFIITQDNQAEGLRLVREVNSQALINLPPLPLNAPLAYRNIRFYRGLLSVNQCCVLVQNLTSISINGTSISTPTTVARAAPEESPKSITDVAMATSK